MSNVKSLHGDKKPEQDEKVADNLKELPESVLKQLSVKYRETGNRNTRGTVCTRIEAILSDSKQDDMSLDEIIVRYWHEHESIVARQLVQRYCAELVKDGKIEQVSKGVFKVAEPTG